jgi:hypothetical protein
MTTDRSPGERSDTRGDRNGAAVIPDLAALIRASAAKLAAIPAGASPADIGVQSMS